MQMVKRHLSSFGPAFKRRSIKIAIFFVLFFAIGHFCNRQTEGFSLASIQSCLPYDKEWEVDPFLQETAISSILDQPFFYLTKGAQCYVFCSKDGKFVLKFFKHRHLRKKKQAVKKDFESYKIAFTLFRKESGLLFLHLNKTSDLHLRIKIVDKLHIEHTIDADHYEFMVQRRAVLVKPKIEEFMSMGDVNGAKGALTALLELIRNRREKGIADEDPNLSKNFGFCESEPLQLDIGRFSLKKEDSERSLQKIGQDFHHWLNKCYPELSKHFEREYERCILTVYPNGS